jgi:hypothetical protein
MTTLRPLQKLFVTFLYASCKKFTSSGITFGPSAWRHSKALLLRSSSSSSFISSVKVGTAFLSIANFWFGPLPKTIVVRQTQAVFLGWYAPDFSYLISIWMAWFSRAICWPFAESLVKLMTAKRAKNETSWMPSILLSGSYSLTSWLKSQSWTTSLKISSFDSIAV